MEVWSEGPVGLQRYSAVATALSAVLQLIVAVPPSTQGILRKVDSGHACGSVILFLQVLSQSSRGPEFLLPPGFLPSC
jgi:hypothetical protein